VLDKLDETRENENGKMWANTDRCAGRSGHGLRVQRFGCDDHVRSRLRVQLSFTAIDIAASSPNAINTGTNAFQADGDGFFDIEFDMPLLLTSLHIAAVAPVDGHRVNLP
jgi:hypothetical protein